MAELAIALVGLGSLYVVCNQKNKSKEQFTNKSDSNEIPNTNIKPTNYPLAQRTANNNPPEVENPQYINQYLHPNQTTDKFSRYFENENENNENENNENENNTRVQSLSGAQMNQSEFRHNNMTPFFGSKQTGSQITSHNNLDNMVGTGTQYIKKVE